MADVFISYKREEREHAERVATEITKAGYQVWWDVELLPGDNFWRDIGKVLLEAKAVVILFSEKARKSDGVDAEANQARSDGKHLPCFLDSVENVPFQFKTVDVLDLSRMSEDPSGLERLIKAVATKVGRAPDLPALEQAEDKAVARMDNVAAEAKLWREVSQSGDPDEFARYLENYGTGGLFSSLARQRIEDITAGANAARSRHDDARAEPEPAPSPPDDRKTDSAEPDKAADAPDPASSSAKPEKAPATSAQPAQSGESLNTGTARSGAGQTWRAPGAPGNLDQRAKALAAAQMRRRLAKNESEEAAPSVPSPTVKPITLPKTRPASSRAKQAKAAPVKDSSSPEVKLWNVIKDSRLPGDFVGYLERYGDTGQFSPLAQQRLKALGGAPRIIEQSKSVKSAHPQTQAKAPVLESPADPALKPRQTAAEKTPLPAAPPPDEASWIDDALEFSAEVLDFLVEFLWNPFVFIAVAALLAWIFLDASQISDMFYWVEGVFLTLYDLIMDLIGMESGPGTSSQ